MHRALTVLAAMYMLATSLYGIYAIEELSERLSGYERAMSELRSETLRPWPTGVMRHVSARDLEIRLPARKVLTVTAYTASVTECDATPGVTASNRLAREGIVAVSRDLFEQGWVFGKRVYIRDFGVFVIDDLMGESKRQCLDILMLSQGQALEFGKRRLEVYLLGA